MKDIRLVRKQHQYVVCGYGGYDTIEYICQDCSQKFIRPGLQQIYHYGMNNLDWWKRYLWWMLNLRDKEPCK